MSLNLKLDKEETLRLTLADGTVAEIQHRGHDGRRIILGVTAPREILVTRHRPDGALPPRPLGRRLNGGKR